MSDFRLTKSIDTFTIEVYNLNGVDYIDISRHALTGRAPDITFVKGDSAVVARFLSQLSELLGTGLITIKGD